MTKRRHRTEYEEPITTPIIYHVRDCVTFSIQPERDVPPQTFTGAITCLPNTSPFGCFHVQTKDDIWFILESEIIGKIGEEQAA